MTHTESSLSKGNDVPTIYKTGHEIADRVADSFIKLGYKEHRLYEKRQIFHDDCHIGYGILRGVGEVYKNCQNVKQKFVFIDKGFFKPGHFEGYYRFGVNYFQQSYEPNGFDDTRLNQILGNEPLELEKYNGDCILVIPPSEAVAEFYHLGSTKIWLADMLVNLSQVTERPIIVRYKSSGTPLDEHLRQAYCVVTHTSSIAWQSLRHGIPSISDPRGIINGWNNLTIRDIDSDKMRVGDIRKLYSYMSQYQFTLKEIEQGRAKHLVEGI